MYFTLTPEWKKDMGSQLFFVPKTMNDDALAMKLLDIFAGYDEYNDFEDMIFLIKLYLESRYLMNLIPTLVMKLY